MSELDIISINHTLSNQFFKIINNDLLKKHVVKDEKNVKSLYLNTQFTYNYRWRANEI